MFGSIPTCEHGFVANAFCVECSKPLRIAPDSSSAHSCGVQDGKVRCGAHHLDFTRSRDQRIRRSHAIREAVEASRPRTSDEDATLDFLRAMQSAGNPGLTSFRGSPSGFIGRLKGEGPVLRGWLVREDPGTYRSFSDGSGYWDGRAHYYLTQNRGLWQVLLSDRKRIGDTEGTLISYPASITSQEAWLVLRKYGVRRRTFR